MSALDTGAKLHCLLEFNESFVPQAFLEQCVCQIIMSSGCPGLNVNGAAKMCDRFVDAPQAKERCAKIAVGVDRSGLEIQSLFEVNSRFSRAASLIEQISEMNLSHRGVWVSRKRCSPEGLHVSIHMALLPG